MTTATRNRIKRHVRMRAGDLVPHELNHRTHNDAQREALSELYSDIGFARSLLAYETADGQLKLIDGHLRQSMDPDMEVEVEVLDVTDEEARKLLLTIDPLAQLASYNNDALDQLRAITHSESPALNNLWASLGQAQTQAESTLNKARRRPKAQSLQETYKILITCEDERSQVDLLRRLKKEGLECTALIS